MLELPTKTYGLPDGSTPISKMSRVERKSAKAQKKAKEDQEIVEAVKASKPKRKGISPRLRAAILERDGYKCGACGLSLGEIRADGSVVKALHVDHRTPVAQGGTDDESNLWVLCDGENLGFGARRKETPAQRPVTVDNNRIVQQLAAIVGKKKKSPA